METGKQRVSVELVLCSEFQEEQGECVDSTLRLMGMSERCFSISTQGRELLPNPEWDILQYLCPSPWANSTCKHCLSPLCLPPFFYRGLLYVPQSLHLPHLHPHLYGKYLTLDLSLYLYSLKWFCSITDFHKFLVVTYWLKTLRELVGQ